MLARRTGGKKEPLPLAGLAERLAAELASMQRLLFDAALARREANSIRGASKAELLDKMAGDGGGGFVYGGYCGSPRCEAEIKQQTKATIRVLPDEEFRSPTVPDKCLWCDSPSVTEAVWAKAY
jgi:prolyl-tRNA synthetase